MRTIIGPRVRDQLPGRGKAEENRESSLYRRRKVFRVEDVMDERNGTIRLLLVDDDLEDVMIVRDMLANHPDGMRMRIDAVSDEASANAALSSHAHDAVLLDYQLAGSDGLALMVSRAEDPSRPPFIVLTGHGNAEIDERCLAAGAADYLTKNTLTADGLVRSIRYSVERHRLARLAARREDEYRQLFELSPMPMWVYQTDSLAIIDVNDAALHQYGYSHDEFRQLSLTDLRSDGERVRFLAFHEQHIDHAEPNFHAGIWRHRRKDGSELLVDIVRRDIEVDGEAHRLVVAVDVTTRLKAEAAIRESYDTANSLLLNLAESLFVLDGNDRIQFTNPSAAALLDADGDALVGTLPPEVLRRASHEPVEFTNPAGELHMLDVHERDIVWHGAPGRVITALDITERRTSQREMALLRRAIEASTDSIVLVDARAHDQPLVYVNSAFERITGYRADEVLGRNCRLLQGDQRDQPELDVLRRALQEGSRCEVVIRNQRKDGSLFFNRLNVSPVVDDQSQITHFIGIQTDITEQRRSDDMRRFLETHDALTGLRHYAGAQNCFERKLAAAKAVGHRLLVLFIDIDAFHTINDAMEFSAGDAALKAFSVRLRDLLGADALITRYAGDKFVVGLDGTGHDAPAVEIALDICSRLALPLLVDGVGELHLTASAGISASTEETRQAAELTRQAEFAMHHAKQRGRNTATAFDHDLQENLEDRVRLGWLMREAFARGEFLLHYQPVVNAHDGQIVGVEALARWNSKELGLLMPRRFIHIAEANGMILPIGQALLRSACEQLRRWTDEGFSGLVVSVNVSPVQLLRHGFIDEVLAIVRETGIEAEGLELELTESVLMDNIDEAVAQMKALRAHGVRFALDDFGVGHSSLSYLQRLPIDKLKIDQSFVKNVVVNGTDATLVRTMVSVAHNLGLRVTAEGVETDAQRNYLRRAKCDLLQGHFLSEPVAADAISALLRTAQGEHAPQSPATEQRTLLILDDEENVRRSLIRLLRRDGYRILEAGNAQEALELLAVNEVQVILSDQRMPGMSGTEFLSRVKSLYPQTVRLVLSGFADIGAVTAAINRGEVYKYLTKPWEDDELRGHIQAAFHRVQGSSFDS
ncbi:MAG: EAL domain-containing protein [Rhodanobacteraceae bacterium]|nr:EAL domain-containing protein [Rhodanobacteraceae bacterium]